MMAEIIGYVAMSHSPFWDKSLDTEGPGSEFTDAVSAVYEKVRKEEIDLVLIFGPDHLRNFFYDLMPAFCMGAGEIDSFGDYGSHEGAVLGAGEIGGQLIEKVRAQGFDPAFSLRMGIDHGIVQPYEVLFPELNIPVVPIMVDCGAAPRPTFQRCHDFGTAVGKAVRELDQDLRVLVIASGGLSHWVKAASPYAEDTEPEMREFLIDGRSTVHEYNAAREAGLAQRIKEGAEGQINPEWDRWFLDQIESGNTEALLNIDSEELEATAGNGAHEVRAWVAGLAAWGGPIQQISYEPVPTWSTGMGLIAGFEQKKDEKA